MKSVDLSILQQYISCRFVRVFDNCLVFFMWAEKNNSLYKEFIFADFIEAFSFMTKVAILAEKLDHHPTWTNTYNKVCIVLQTHDQGNVITEKDRALAFQIDGLFL